MPPLGAILCPSLDTAITLTSAPGSAAVFNNTGINSLVNSACPR